MRKAWEKLLRSCMDSSTRWLWIVYILYVRWSDVLTRIIQIESYKKGKEIGPSSIRRFRQFRTSFILLRVGFLMPHQFLGTFFALVAHIDNAQFALSHECSRFVSHKNLYLHEIDQFTRANCLQEDRNNSVVLLIQNIKRMKTSFLKYSLSLLFTYLIISLLQ